MPHESTTDHESIKFQEDDEGVVQSRRRSRSFPADNFTHHSHDRPNSPHDRPTRTLSLVAETPMKITHHHDDDYDDDESRSTATEDITA